MKQPFIVIAATVSLLTSNGLVNAMGFGTYSEDWTSSMPRQTCLVGTLSLGFGKINTSNETLFLTPDIEKTYAPESASHNMGELFVGMQTSLSYSVSGQLGIEAGFLDTVKYSGEIWDDGDPFFNNYSYHYTVDHSRLLVKGKLLYNLNDWFIPWVSAGAGVAYNRAEDFSSTPLIPEADPTPAFTNNSNIALSFSLGIGAQTTLTEHWQIGIGYEFVDLGSNELGRAPEQITSSGLKQDSFYTNAILINLTYLA